MLLPWKGSNDAFLSYVKRAKKNCRNIHFVCICVELEIKRGKKAQLNHNSLYIPMQKIIHVLRLNYRSLFEMNLLKEPNWFSSISQN